MKIERVYLKHIEGLRAVAALLVVFYHIFFDKVSGGVDVFFVVSGFLIFTSLVIKSEGGGSGVLKFFVDIFLRLLPLSILVLLLIILWSLFFIPEVSLPRVYREILASALYYENWELAFKSIDYLDREEPPSPVQHYWAMSMQMQFYVMTAIFVTLYVFLCRVLRFGLYGKGVFVFLFSLMLLLVLSFSYSVYSTLYGEQAWAYFNTFARYWEFLIGCFVAVAFFAWPNIKIHYSLGWIGLIGLLGTGVVLSVESAFPGYAALLPTLSAVMILLGGKSEHDWSIGRFLGSKMMVMLGGSAYAIYLVHWPILIFYREAVSSDVTVFAGVVIVAASIMFAFALKNLVESYFIKVKRSDDIRKKRKVLAVLFSVFLLVVIIPASYVKSSFFSGYEIAFDNPGARLLEGSDGWELGPINMDRLVPELSRARRSLAKSYSDRSHADTRCHLSLSEDEAVWCVYGPDTDFSHTVAVVGGSHSAQWLPAVELIAQRHNIRIMYMTASSCRFQSGYDENSRCSLIYDKVLKDLFNMKPDFVYTTANVADQSEPSARYIDPWMVLDAADIPVIAVRDNPRFEEDPTLCLADAGPNGLKCSQPRNQYLSRDFSLGSAPGNVYLVDLSNYLCNSDACPPVVGDVIVNRDRHHLTVPYVMTLAPTLERMIFSQLELSETSIDEGVVSKLLGKK